MLSMKALGSRPTCPAHFDSRCRLPRDKHSSLQIFTHLCARFQAWTVQGMAWGLPSTVRIEGALLLASCCVSSGRTASCCLPARSTASYCAHAGSTARLAPLLTLGMLATRVSTLLRLLLPQMTFSFCIFSLHNLLEMSRQLVCFLWEQS